MKVVYTTNSRFPPLLPDFSFKIQSVLSLLISNVLVSSWIFLPAIAQAPFASASQSSSMGESTSTADFPAESWPEVSREFNAVPIPPLPADQGLSSSSDVVMEAKSNATAPSNEERALSLPSLKERLAPLLPHGTMPLQPNADRASSDAIKRSTDASARYLDSLQNSRSTVDEALNHSERFADSQMSPQGGETAPAEPTDFSTVELNPSLIFTPLQARTSGTDSLGADSSRAASAYVSPSQPWLSASYTLSVGDRLSVIFQNVPEYTAQYQVQLDGSLQLPVIGRLPVWGLTLSEVEERIEQVYSKADILRNPHVSLSLLAMAPPRIAISGEVSKPGSYRLALLDTNVMPTVTDALQQAGGITQRTNLQRVHIDRRLPSGEHQRLTVNLWTLLKSGDLTQDVALRDGDSLTLEVAPPLDNAQAIALGNANVAQGSITVGIWGETQQAGTFEIPPNTPLNQVLLAAGGFNERAQRKTVDLIRLNPNGNVTQQTITVDLAASVSETHNPIIQDRDIIVVEASRLFRFSDRLNRVVTPFTNTINQVLQPVSSVFSVMNVFELFRGFFGNAAP